MEKKFFKSSPRVGWNILRPKDSRIIVHLHHLTIISMMTSATLRVTSSSVKMKYLYPGNLSLHISQLWQLSQLCQYDQMRRAGQSERSGEKPGKREAEKSIPSLKIVIGSKSCDMFVEYCLCHHLTRIWLWTCWNVEFGKNRSPDGLLMSGTQYERHDIFCIVSNNNKKKAPKCEVKCVKIRLLPPGRAASKSGHRSWGELPALQNFSLQ